MRKIMGRVPKPLLVGLLIAFVISAFGWVGESDYEQELKTVQLYCEMSDQGLWPPRPEYQCPAKPLTPNVRLVAL